MNEDWRAGALAEAEARDEDLNADVRQVRDYVEAIARLYQGYGAREVAASTARVFLAGQPLRTRLRLAWELIRG